jgi:oxygen-independent coproporphyrinogen-3 oxidase
MPAGLYIHIPFCVSKCAYCDFFSSTRLGMMPAILDTMEREMEWQRDFVSDHKIKTIYFGGGTPSLCSPADIDRILRKAGALWECGGVEEVTLEANPDDIDREYLRALRDTGVNRLSIGLQSTYDRYLRFMRRRHTAEQATRAVADAQRAGFDNISIDLIYGIPGMSLAEWEEELRRAIDMGVQHISAYHLTIEPRTPFGRMAAEGKLLPITEEQSEAQYLLLHRMLTDAGFEHYEISNFALPQRRAMHNSAYWSGDPYLGIGPAAHSYNGDLRRWSPTSIAQYIKNISDGLPYERETLTATDKYNEFVMSSLRCADGVDLTAMRHRFGDALTKQFIAAASRFERLGIMLTHADHIAIAPEKFIISDSVISELFM